MEKYQAGIISREEAATKSQDPTTMSQKLAEWEAAQAEAAAAEAKRSH
jgi:ribosome modulation factor